MIPVRNIRNLRIATSVSVAGVLIAMGYFLTSSEDITESTRRNIMLVGAIIIVLNLLLPLAYVYYLSRKGPEEEE